MAKFWVAERKKKFRGMDQYAGRNAAAMSSFRSRGFDRADAKRGGPQAKNCEDEHDRFRGFHLKACPPPQAAGSSGYGGKPAARVARSASLFMTLSGGSPPIICAFRKGHSPSMVAASDKSGAGGLVGDPYRPRAEVDVTARVAGG